MFLLLALGTATAIAADALTFVHVYSGWRDAASFKRISEYFNGRENTGGQVVLRTHPEERSGFYFLVRVANPGPPMAVKFSLEIIQAADSTPATHAFSTTLGTGNTVLNLGLTGPDWPNAAVHPAAWKLLAVADDGRVLAAEKSYLWDRPETK